MWELDYKESWTIKKTVVLEKTLESSLGCKEIKLVNPKINQSWIINGGTDAEAETPILWPPDAKNWLLRKDTDAGKDWRHEEKEWQRMRWFAWHHWTKVWASSGSWWWTGRPGVCSPCGCKESDTTEQLNWTYIPSFIYSTSIYLVSKFYPVLLIYHLMFIST